MNQQLTKIEINVDLEQFTENVHNNAVRFRRKKIKEFLGKKELERTEMEESIIRSWIKIYGRETY